MANDEAIFLDAVNSRKLPILVLDNKYHDLKNKVGSSELMTMYEDELNNLLKAQGKANTEIKEIKKLKKKLLQEIVDNADENSNLSSSLKEKKAEDNKRLINECNEKIEQYENDIVDLPKEIDDVNKKLMKELMSRSYEVLKTNENEIKNTASWITKVRIELKKKLIKKTDMEEANQKIYAFMHDLFGSEVIELFDMEHKDTE